MAICARVAKRDFKTVNNVLIIDLDVHQGDGTASIFSDDNSIFTFSMHCESNFPLKKMVSDLDIPLKKGMKDEEYLNVLNLNLDRLNQIPSDIIFFQAGVDALDSDALGLLKLSREGLKSRNEKVFAWRESMGIPMILFMGGGYARPIEDTVDAFSDLFLDAANNLKS